jgi:hypothetical protein
MSAEAELALADILKNYGRSVCDTPRMFEMMIRQHPNVPADEITALVAALHHHVTKHLLANPACDQQALVQALSAQGKVPLLTARWAVETWAKALGGVKPEKKVSNWDEVGRAEGIGAASARIARWALIGMALVALSGAAGGTIPGVTMGYLLLKRDPGAIEIVAAADMADAKDPAQFMVVYGTLGGLAGFVGAGLGWMFGGHTRMTIGRVLGAMIGAFQAGVNGAYFGMIHGEGAGTFIGAFVVTAFVTYIATLMGVLILLLFISQFAYLLLGDTAWVFRP